MLSKDNIPAVVAFGLALASAVALAIFADGQHVETVLAFAAGVLVPSRIVGAEK